MCNACGFFCCASDEFFGCGCDDCYTSRCHTTAASGIDDMEEDYYYEMDDEEWDECSHTMSCCCEDCYQSHPERFDEDGNNYWVVEVQEAGNGSKC